MVDTAQNMRRARLVVKGRPLVDKIKAIKTKSKTLSSDEAATVARLFGGDRELFRFMDEKPGAFDSSYGRTDWFWKLRQARNNHPIFFEILEGKAK